MLKYVAVSLAVALGLVVYNVTHVPPLPNVDLNRWWGRGGASDVDTTIRPFRIVFDNPMVKDLKYRLANRRPAARSLDGAQSHYGINSHFIDQVVRYWHDKYDFKAREDNLNKQPHFKTNIQGLDIHFIHAKPQLAAGSTLRVLPLLLLHGWPSSSKEFEYLIPLLTAPREGHDFVFEVVSPDLPGFGYSEGTTKPGLNAMETGLIMRNLMHRLGFRKFYVQAGDWGSQAATHIATLLPDDILGLHINMPYSQTTLTTIKILIGALYPSLAVDERYTHRLYPLKDIVEVMVREAGYLHIQATKPDTVGIGTSDSPSGLAAYMLEKMAVVTNRDLVNTTDGGILKAFSMDDLLDLITINWANNCGTTSMRIYAETLGSMKASDLQIVERTSTPVPTAIINFRYEVMYLPDWILRDKFPNLVHSTTLDFGGHFAAWENPNSLADDFWTSVESFIRFRGQNAD